MKNKGFIALILVVVISSLMLAFSFMQSIEFGHFFDQVQTKEYRLISHYSAYSCIDQALLNLTHDYFFITLKKIEYSDLDCYIDYVIDSNDGNNEKIISVYGRYKNIVTYSVARARLFDDHLEIISIK